MTTQYTPVLKLALPVTGELSGTWGDVVNNNITSMVEQAIAGLSTINTWTTNSHTLTTANGTTSEARCAMLVADDDGAGNPSAAATIICPAAAKLYVLKNISGQTVTLKTASGSGVAVSNNDTAFLFCDGTNVEACVTSIVNGHISGNLTVDGNTTLGDASSDTVTINATNTTITQGVANRVMYLNASKVISGAAGFTFDGTTLSSTKFAGALDGTVGATTPSTGAFTTLSASGQARISGAVSTNSAGLTFGYTSGTNVGLVGSWGNSGATRGILSFYLSDGAGSNGNEYARLTDTGLSVTGTSTSTGYGTFKGLRIGLDGSNDIYGAANTINYTVDSGFGHIFRTGGTLRAQIDATGLAVTGTVSATNGAGYGTATLNGTSGGYLGLQYGGVEKGNVYANTGGLTFTAASGLYQSWWNGATEQMRLDASGNLGIGVTPSAWGSGIKAFDISAGAVVATTNTTEIHSNSLFNGTNNLFKAAGFAAKYSINSNAGTHTWYTSGTSGSGGAGISGYASSVMTLDASGQLTVGATSPFYTVANRGNISVNGSTSAIFALGVGGVASGYLYTDANAVTIGAPATKPITFDINGERARFDTNGNLGLGVAPSVNYGREIDLTADIASGILTLGMRNMAAANSIIYLASNAKNVGSGTDNYWITSQASTYKQINGAHTWQTAASGTAGTAISWTTSLYLAKGRTLTLEGAADSAGTGIAFPATQSASTDPNTLDDYEEGTFTPTIYGTTTAGSGTYAATNGKYTKIGNVVYYYALCSWTAHTGTGNIGMAGLPFTPTGPSINGSIYVGNLTYTGAMLTSYATSGSTNVTIEQVSSGGANIGIPMDTSATIAVSGFYYV